MGGSPRNWLWMYVCICHLSDTLQNVLASLVVAIDRWIDVDWEELGRNIVLDPSLEPREGPAEGSMLSVCVARQVRGGRGGDLP